jgi:hypothetical protein
MVKYRSRYRNLWVPLIGYHRSNPMAETKSKEFMMRGITNTEAKTPILTKKKCFKRCKGCNKRTTI